MSIEYRYENSVSEIFMDPTKQRITNIIIISNVKYTGEDEESKLFFLFVFSMLNVCTNRKSCDRNEASETIIRFIHN